MNAPFYQYGLINDGLSLIIAIFIGIGFGFFLERAGFGNSRKLAAQFYFYDMTVFKVMFTAIITAMLGLFWLGWIGFVDLTRIVLVPTYYLPELTGGLIFGVGFVMGGFCPGTCVVASSTGKIDGLFSLLGLIFGIFLFGESFPVIEKFYNSTPAGELTLTDLFGIPYGYGLLIIVLIALIGFYFSEKLEKKFSVKLKIKE